MGSVSDPLGELGADCELPIAGGLWWLPDPTSLPPEPSATGSESVLPRYEEEESNRQVCLHMTGG